jgi:hypothetical protein
MAAKRPGKSDMVDWRMPRPKAGRTVKLHTRTPEEQRRGMERTLAEMMACDPEGTESELRRIERVVDRMLGFRMSDE